MQVDLKSSKGEVIKKISASDDIWLLSQAEYFQENLCFIVFGNMTTTEEQEL